MSGPGQELGRAIAQEFLRALAEMPADDPALVALRGKLGGGSSGSPLPAAVDEARSLPALGSAPVTMTEAEAAVWRPSVPGWSEDILPWYHSLAPTLPKGAVVVEVGVSSGRSLLFLAEQLVKLGRTDVELWGVDLWRGGEESAKLARLLSIEATGAERALMRVVQCEGARAARLFEDRSVDVLFIDSDHERPGMIEHLLAWVNPREGSKIKPGGIVSGHDYCAADWPGVVEAVDEFFADAGPWGDHSPPVEHPTRSVWSWRAP